MPSYFVSVNERLGPAVDAPDPVTAARKAAQQLDAAPGSRLYVRWDVVCSADDPEAFLMARVAEVLVDGAWVVQRKPAAETAAPADKAPPAKKPSAAKEAAPAKKPSATKEAAPAKKPSAAKKGVPAKK